MPNPATETELTEEERAAAGAGEVSERRKRDDEDEKYEVVVDGHPFEVTLGEALNGYVRQETFHQRMGEVNQLRNALEEDHQRQQSNWQLIDEGEGGLRERRSDDDACRAGLGSRVRDQPATRRIGSKRFTRVCTARWRVRSKSGRRWRRSMRRRRIDGCRNTL